MYISVWGFHRSLLVLNSCHPTFFYIMIHISDSDARMLLAGIRLCLRIIDRHSMDNKSYNIIRRMSVFSKKMARKIDCSEKKTTNNKTIEHENERLQCGYHPQDFREDNNREA